MSLAGCLSGRLAAGGRVDDDGGGFDQQQHGQQQQDEYVRSSALLDGDDSSDAIPFNVSQAIHAREAGARKLRSIETRLRSTYAAAQPWLLKPQHFTAAQKDVDKAFAAAWTGPDAVLVATKCNSLLRLDVVTGACARVPLPPQPAARLGPSSAEQPGGGGGGAGGTSSSNPDGHCGMHALAVSPDGRYVAAGGAAAEDIVVFRIAAAADSTSSTSTTTTSSTSPSSGGMAPVRTFSGHADWVFGLAWVTDRHFVSCSRDATVKLWAVTSDDDGARGASAGAGAGGGGGLAGYNPEPAAALASALDKQRAAVKQRDVRPCGAGGGRVATLGVDGTVAVWDAAGGLRLERRAGLNGGGGSLDSGGAGAAGAAREFACLAALGHLVAAGSRSHLHLLDLRARRACVGVVPVTDNGVRSLGLAGHLLSAGTGDAALVFYDLRYLKRAGGGSGSSVARRVAGGGAGGGGGSAGMTTTATATMMALDPSAYLARGHQPLELGRLAMPPSAAAAAAEPWGWAVRDTVYAHAWDASGARLFMAGGPLAVGMRGCSLSAWL